MKRQEAFTLIELVAVIILLGILVIYPINFIINGVDNLIETKNRAKLMANTDIIAHNLRWDLKKALPNSIRTYTDGTDDYFLELVTIFDIAAYKSDDFIPDASTYYLSLFHDASSDAQSVCTNGANACRAVISNKISGAGETIYNFDTGPSASNVITKDIDVYLDGARTLKFDTGWKFPAALASHKDRVYLIKNNAAVTYHCDTANNTLKKYWNYEVQDSQPNNPAASPLNSGSTKSTIIAKDVVSCDFTYSQPMESNATGTQRALLGVTIMLKNADGETMTYTDQIAVMNNDVTYIVKEEQNLYAS